MIGTGDLQLFNNSAGAITRTETTGFALWTEAPESKQSKIEMAVSMVFI
jgi:hypothetical protein